MKKVKWYLREKFTLRMCLHVADMLQKFHFIEDYTTSLLPRNKNNKSAVCEHALPTYI